MISGFRREVDENAALFWTIMQRVVAFRSWMLAYI